MQTRYAPLYDSLVLYRFVYGVGPLGRDSPYEAGQSHRESAPKKTRFHHVASGRVCCFIAEYDWGGIH